MKYLGKISDNKDLVTKEYVENYAPAKAGTGASGTWGISISGNAATSTKATQDSDGSAINTTYLKKRSIIETSTSNSTGRTTAGTLSVLRLYGATYGNDAAYLSTSERFSYGDPGPQIQFSSAATGGQQGALIFTDHDTMGIGVSLSFVTDQDDAYFIAPHIKALSGFVGSLSGNASTATTATNATNIYSSASTAKAYVLGTTTASSANHATVYNASVYTQNAILYGAAWNDYAEYRKAETLEPGRCIKEDASGKMKLTTKRMEKGCEIISDTFGFAIGETENEKTPIAVTGRVLAYTDKDRNSFELGMPVCSGPNGTVSQMTEEEARMYPWCIIGTVSEIPNYEEWGTGKVKVNNRIWIRVK